MPIADSADSHALDAVVVGGSAFGRLHVRELLQGGIRRLGIVGRSAESAAATAAALGATHKSDIRALADLDAALAARPRIVTVCTPPQTHLAFLDVLAAHPAYVFCEKPMFWDPRLSPDDAQARAKALFERFDGRLLVNHLNTLFGDKLRLAGHAPRQRFAMRFRAARAGDIREFAADVMPHAASVLIALLGAGSAARIDARFSKTGFEAAFDWNGCACTVAFARADAPSAMEIACDARVWTRVQTPRADGSMDVSLTSPGLAALVVPNPLRHRFARFLDASDGGTRFDGAAAEACAVVRASYELLKAAP